VPAAGVLAPQASAALTAREIRIANHPAFVRVVVDFTGGRVQPGEVNATDPNPFPDGFVRLPLTRPGVRTTADSVREEGVFARVAQTSNRRITIRLTGADRRFKYVHYFALHGPERLVLDLYRSRPPTDAAEIVRGAAAAACDADGAFTSVCEVKSPATRGAAGPASLIAAVDVRRQRPAY
jgi:hypothetical protein